VLIDTYCVRINVTSCCTIRTNGPTSVKPTPWGCSGALTEAGLKMTRYIDSSHSTDSISSLLIGQLCYWNWHTGLTLCCGTHSAARRLLWRSNCLCDPPLERSTCQADCLTSQTDHWPADRHTDTESQTALWVHYQRAPVWNSTLWQHCLTTMTGQSISSHYATVDRRIIW